MKKCLWMAACVWSWTIAVSAVAGESPSVTARAGIDLVASAAESWAGDAVLVYVENDEALDGAGRATRWGFLYRSDQRRESRAYSVRDGKVVVAETFDLRFDPPQVTPAFIDSDRALAAATKAAADFTAKQGGTLATMLLMRGAFHDDEPDRTTWTVIFAAEAVPSLYVVIDAESGHVVRTWRG